MIIILKTDPSRFMYIIIITYIGRGGHSGFNRGELDYYFLIIPQLNFTSNWTVATVNRFGSRYRRGFKVSQKFLLTIYFLIVICILSHRGDLSLDFFVIFFCKANELRRRCRAGESDRFNHYVPIGPNGIICFSRSTIISRDRIHTKSISAIIGNVVRRV